MTPTVADGAALFEAHRAHLFGVAYRMLGSVMEAEDAVQDAWLRWQAAPRDDVANPRAWLVTTVTRLCLDALTSARARRETYTGPWLPEPLLTAREPSSSPSERIEHAESISFAFLLLLERLGPVERAVFLLHDVFDYGYGEIAAMVGKSEAACRQVLHRARERVAEPRRRFSASYDERLRLTRRFIEASGHGDMAGLIAILAPDAALSSDGGGVVAAARNVIRGAEKVARLSLALPRKVPRERVQYVEVNGAPAVLLFARGRLDTVMVMDVDDGRITDLHSIRNPEKLHALVRALGGERVNARM